jgi:hypothetical protein
MAKKKKAGKAAKTKKAPQGKEKQLPPWMGKKGKKK